MSNSLAPSKPTARDKLDASSLDQSQLELMGHDVDLDAFNLQMRGVVGVDLVKAITRAEVQRSIEGSSLLTVDVQDHDRKLLRSGRLHGAQDVQIDGLWFRLSALSKQGDSLTLTFEDREIAVLRTYDKIIKQTQATSRSHVTRAEFILRLLREVKEFRIKYVIPELHKTQPVEKSQDTATWGADPPANNNKKGYGVPNKSNVTVKGQRATAIQISNANAILNTGASMVLPRKLLVIAMMVAIQENSISNTTSPDNPDHHGVFQQDPDYWPASGDVSTDAAAFFRALVKVVRIHPNAAYYQLAEDVQQSGNAQAYAQWRTEAERWVTAYGLPNTNAADANLMNSFAGGQGDYEFYRGEPPTNGFRKWQKENSWDCIQRLAAEVNWRAFFVSGTFYYMYEDELFKSKPLAIVDEDSLGVDSIDGNITPNKRSSHRGYEYEDSGSITVTARIGRWQAPPGSVVQFQNMGPWDGRWLVSTVTRSLYSSSGSIELKKPMPKLPEPGQSNLPSGQGTDSTWTTPITPGSGKYVSPFAKSGSVIVGRIDQGVDFHGTGVITAPGRVKVIGDGGQGWPGGHYLLVQLLDGPHAGQYIYIAEAIIPTVQAGDIVQAGQPLAKFGPGAAPGASPGIEMGWGSPVINVTAAAAAGDVEGGSHHSPQGEDFADFLRNLGVPV